MDVRRNVKGDADQATERAVCPIKRCLVDSQMSFPFISPRFYKVVGQGFARLENSLVGRLNDGRYARSKEITDRVSDNMVLMPAYKVGKLLVTSEVGAILVLVEHRGWGCLDQRL